MRQPQQQSERLKVWRPISENVKNWANEFMKNQINCKSFGKETEENSIRGNNGKAGCVNESLFNAKCSKTNKWCKARKTINRFLCVKALIILAIALSKEWKRLKPSQHYHEREVENILKALHVFSRSFNEKRWKREGLVRYAQD